MEQNDEIDQLLDEIPRATSAPSALEEFHRASNMHSGASFFGGAQDDSVRPLMSEDGYHSIFTDSAKPMTSQLYSGFMLDNRQKSQHQQGAESSVSLGTEEMQQQQQQLFSDDSLASSFSNLNCGSSYVSKNRKQSNGFVEHEWDSYSQLDSGYCNSTRGMGLLSKPADYSSSKMYIDTSNFSSGPSQEDKLLNSAAGLQAYTMGSSYAYPASWMLANTSVSDQVDMDMLALLQAQRAQVALQQRLLQQQMEERLRQRQQQKSLFLQSQLEAYALHGQPGSSGMYSHGRHSLMNPLLSLSAQKQIQQLAAMRNMGWIDQHTQGVPAIASSNLDSVRNLPGGNVCRYYAQGYCSRGETCPFLHTQPQILGKGYHAGFVKDALAAVLVSPEERFGFCSFPEKILSRKSPKSLNAFPAVIARKKTPATTNAEPSPLLSSDHLSQATQGEGALRSLYEQQQPKYTSLDEVEGQIYSIAKDQHGCRFLQKKFDEGNAEDIQKIFVEVVDHIIELMTDPFGNYLVQKLLEVSDDTQRKEILRTVTRKGELVNISLNMHGTRAVQKLIETLKSPEEVSMVTNSLKQGIVTLIKDLNGNHVVQKCLQRLCNEDSQFIFDAAACHCVEIATHRHGCCVLQRCVDFASGGQRHFLVSEIASNALVLSQDQYGNYVIQYILELGLPWASLEVMLRLEGNYALLAMQKFSSNVVEKCLKQAGDDTRTRIIREIITSSLLSQLLQDPFANYVIQCALSVTKGSLHAALVEAIRPHLPSLRSSPYGKRILSRANIKK